MRSPHPLVPALLVLPLLSLLSAGCAFGRPLETKSGLPEIVVRETQRPKVRRILGDEMAARGFEPVLASDRVMVFRKPSDDMDAVLIHGAGWNLTGDFRVTCTLYEQPGGTHIMAEIEIVTDPGEDTEEAREAPKGLDIAHELQDILEYVQGTVALHLHDDRIRSLERSNGSEESPVWQGDR